MIGDASLRLRAARASVAVAGVLTAAKLGAYLVTESVAMLSSLIDSSVDLVASALLLLAVAQAQRPPDRSHRFGHGKAEPLAALGQGAFVVGSALFLFFESARRLVHGVPVVHRHDLGIATMGFAMLLTGILVVYQRSVIRRTGSVAIAADRVHYAGDFMSHLAVIAGLVLAQVTGFTQIDTLFGIGIGLWLVWNARSIILDALDYLMDRELPQATRDRIKEIVRADPDTRGLHDLRTRSTGTGEFIELHLELDGRLSLKKAHEITDRVEAALQAAYPRAEITIHQEPAGLEDDRLDTRIATGRKPEA